MSINFDRFFSNLRPIDRTQETQNAEEGQQQRQAAGPRVSIDDPIVDTLNLSSRMSDKHKTLLGIGLAALIVSPLAVLGAISTMMVAAGPEKTDNFLQNLLAKHGLTFGNQNNDAAQNAAQTQTADAQPQAETTPVTDTTEAPAEEETPLTPLQIAQQRYGDLQAKYEKGQNSVSKKEARATELEQQAEHTRARLARAEEAYQSAADDQKAALKEKADAIRARLRAKEADATVAREAVDVANAKLNRLSVKLEEARSAWEYAYAEETVDVA